MRSPDTDKTYSTSNTANATGTNSTTNPVRTTDTAVGNPAQQEAIRHVDGPMLVLAGPGSGKTFVITNRVKFLIEEAGVPPESILVITFSRAAAEEMSARFRRLCDNAYSGVTFGTFHACFFHMLQYARGYRPTDILKESEATDIVSRLLTDTRREYADDPALVRDICAELLKVKCSLVDSTRVELGKYAPSTCEADTFRKVFTDYRAELRRLRKVDFEDMLLLTKEFLEADGEALAFWRRRYRYLLIDEFQDVNRLQYDIVRLLVGPEANLFAVGDDDQSIYGFRGSDPTIMIDFPKDLPNAKVLTLPVNYRSTPEIIAAADALIVNNRVRYQKAYTSATPSGAPVRMQLLDTVASENDFFLSELASLTAAGASYRDVAVLFRTNLQMRSLRDALSRACIPYRIRGDLPSLYDQPAVRIVLAYLKAAHGNRARTVILTIANQPKRYLERRYLQGETIDLAAIRELARRDNKAYLANNVDHLMYDLEMLSRMNPFAAVHYVRRVIGLDAHLLSSAEHREDVLEALDELQETMRDYRTADELWAAIEREREERRRRPPVHDSGEDSVTLMTFHASKGLEYDHVFLFDCNETLIPHKKALLPESIEEERRLLYVAMTRARKTLTMLYVAKRFGRELPPSGFLGEILLPVTALTPGVRVSHRQFGEGTVLSLAEDRLRIRFDRFLMPKTLSYRLCAQEMLLRIRSN